MCVVCGVWCEGEFFLVYVCRCLRESVRFFVFVFFLCLRLCFCASVRLCLSVSV
jgi:hypothetical protein